MSGVAIQELQYAIFIYQRRINEIQSEITELLKKKEALKRLELANDKRTSKFWNLHERQKKRLCQISEAQTIRYAEGYRRNLNGYLSGNQHSRAVSSLDEINRTLKLGISRCADDILQRQQEIQKLEREIVYLRERIGYLQALMAQAQA